MVIEGNSDIILSCEFKPHTEQGDSQWLVFRNGMVLVLGEGFMALYKDANSTTDPLGNGLTGMVDLDVTLAKAESGFVERYAAGFVGLVDEKAILITPNDIQLFHNSQDALRNQNEIARLALA